jgi:hypothetical protein
MFKMSSIIWLWKRPAAKGELELLFVLPEVHSKGAIRESD